MRARRKPTIDKGLVVNNERVNAPFNLFSRVHPSLIEGPITPEPNNDIICDDFTKEEKILNRKKENLNKIKQVSAKLAKMEKVYDVEILTDEQRDLVDPDTLKRIKLPNNKQKRDMIQDYLSVKLGSDGRKLLDQIIVQAMYQFDPETEVVKKYSDETIRFSQKILMEYGFFKPTVMKSNAVTVEHKLDSALKAIHDNRERIKLLN
jgi:hypothetical protein